MAQPSSSVAPDLQFLLDRDFRSSDLWPLADRLDWSEKLGCYRRTRGRMAPYHGRRALRRKKRQNQWQERERFNSKKWRLRGVRNSRAVRPVTFHGRGRHF